MRQIAYAMRFNGLARPANDQGTVLRAATTAPSMTISSTVGSAGLDNTIDAVPGDQAQFESEVTFTGPTSFVETGSISFGNGNRIVFSTVGSGFLDEAVEPGLKHGAVAWHVDGGEGQFEGASGLITSNFFVGGSGEVTDHHFGVLFVQ